MLLVYILFYRIKADGALGQSGGVRQTPVTSVQTVETEVVPTLPRHMMVWTVRERSSMRESVLIPVRPPRK